MPASEIRDHTIDPCVIDLATMETEFIAKALELCNKQHPTISNGDDNRVPEKLHIEIFFKECADKNEDRNIDHINIERSTPQPGKEVVFLNINQEVLAKLIATFDTEDWQELIEAIDIRQRDALINRAVIKAADFVRGELRHLRISLADNASPNGSNQEIKLDTFVDLLHEHLEETSEES